MLALKYGVLAAAVIQLDFSGSACCGIELAGKPRIHVFFFLNSLQSSVNKTLVYPLLSGMMQESQR